MPAKFTITHEEIDAFGQKVKAFGEKLSEKEQALLHRLLAHARSDIAAKAAENGPAEGDGGDAGTDVQLFAWLEKLPGASALAVATPLPSPGDGGVTSMPATGELREGAGLAGLRGD